MNGKFLLLAAVVLVGLSTVVFPALAQTWVQTSAPTNVMWGPVASSADGTKLVAGASGFPTRSGGIYVSTDSGTS
jgi:hypothetical protein